MVDIEASSPSLEQSLKPWDIQSLHLSIIVGYIFQLQLDLTLLLLAKLLQHYSLADLQRLNSLLLD